MMSSKFPHTRAQLAAIARQYGEVQSPGISGGSTTLNDNSNSTMMVTTIATVTGTSPSIDALLPTVLTLLTNEQSDELKAFLADTFRISVSSSNGQTKVSSGIPTSPKPTSPSGTGSGPPFASRAEADYALEQSVLELMHKHRDDLAGVPFLFLTPTRRPISRPSSRASSIRGGVGQNSATVSTGNTGGQSPTTQWTASLPASPLSSPRLLSAKAMEFRPIQRPLSAAATHSSTFLRAESVGHGPGSLFKSDSHGSAFFSRDTPSPLPLPVGVTGGDLWGGGLGIGIGLGSPTSAGLASSLSTSSPRAPSNLAIAAPLVAGPLQNNNGIEEDDDTDGHEEDKDKLENGEQLAGEVLEEEDDQFPIPSYHSISVPDPDVWQPSEGASAPGTYAPLHPHYYAHYIHPHIQGPPPPPPLAHTLPLSSSADDDFTGMTPFDVLTSVFGSTLAPSELEEALAANGYDFERAMGYLVDRASSGGQGQGQGQGQVPQPTSPQARHLGVSGQGKVTVVPRGVGVNGKGVGVVPGVVLGNGNGAGVGRGPRYYGRPVASGNRVCRYFIAGECLRSDCRFSHDLERALCRFWLRGTCAKQDNCEFLHHLPKDVDVQALNALMAKNNLSGPPGPSMGVNAAMSEEFPALGYDPATCGRSQGAHRKAYIYDPSRTRFAAAVKKPPPPHNPANEEANQTPLHPSLAIIAPKPSPRLKLHPPILLPTLPTGETLNSLYLTYRSRALQLGQARNACLARAAEAWRRGDGAGAKRMSREGEEMNKKMKDEMRVAADGIVRERARVVEGVVKNSGLGGGTANGSHVNADRGKMMGGGLGVCLGVGAESSGTASISLTLEERMEVMLDLHGLHANEATDVLEEFLLALEREHFYGLAYVIVGEEKHTGTGPHIHTSASSNSTTNSSANSASASGSTSLSRGMRLAAGVREWLHRWGYPWSERDGVICVDPLTHLSE